VSRVDVGRIDLDRPGVESERFAMLSCLLAGERYLHRVR
jgi:hypothetical protein